MSDPPIRGIPDLVRLDATDLAAAIRSKRVSCREVLSTYLDHIDRFNPRVNAIVSLQDRSDLLRQADERDAQLARGEYLGWLHGFPHAVKDLVATRGIRTTQGSPIFRDAIPAADALLVQRLKHHGAIIIGKTNTPEFGLGSQTYNPVFGTTLNAYDQTKTAGGSSGGAAAALALRMLPVADGSDLGGSLRNPAAFNNVIGFRPSFGRIPRAPAVDVFVQQLSTDGPMGRTVTDVAHLLAVLAGRDDRWPASLDGDPHQFTGDLATDHRGTRIGWLGDFDGYLPFEPGVLDLGRSAFPAFEAIGCTIEEARPEFPPDRVWPIWLTLRHWSSAGSLGDHYRDPGRRELLKPEARWEVEGGLQLPAVDVYRASVARTAWYQAVRQLFDEFDFLMLPTSQVFPFDADVHWPAAIAGVAMDSYHRWMEVAIFATLTGCPVINLPAGFNPAGLPMGIQVIGPPRADLAVLSLAYAHEHATGWVRHRLPPALTAP